MLEEREDYVSPVGFATEPAGQRWKWIGRAMLALLVAGIAWLMINRVLTPPPDGAPVVNESTLPGPI